MSKLKLLVFCVSLLFFNSCSIPFETYLRNMSGATAIVDVYLLNTKWMKTLPNRVDVANSLLDFKCGYKNHIDSSQVVDWKEINHFQLAMKPNTTADLTDMAGGFTNGYPHWKVSITITVNNRIDTVMNGSADYIIKKFAYRYKRFSKPVVYYDIKP
ncbi:MAG: hypothetical protein IPP72_14035 [Chitinophagaceae bacterium]|nr:hypothetical protein [Chitinophagaceae bacterium]